MPLLDLDPELTDCVPRSELADARLAALAQTMFVPVGRWTSETREPDPGHMGYLLLEGLMSRELHIAGACSVEQLGTGDIARPW